MKYPVTFNAAIEVKITAEQKALELKKELDMIGKGKVE